MSRRRRRRGRPWSTLLAALATAAIALVAAAPAAWAGWSRPFQFTTPGSLDYLAPTLAFSSSGAAAAAFGIADVDTPGVSQAYLSTRSVGGRVGSPRAVVGSAQILDLTYDGRTLELLTGSAPSGLTCCSSAQAITVGADGSPGRPRTLVGGLTGSTQGQLLTLGGGQMLAAVATERGVWAVQSSRGDRFGAPHLLTHGGQMPEAMSAAWLGAGNTVIAWTAATGTAGTAAPRSIDVSGGTRRAAPHRARTAITVPAGHRIDELAVARRGGGATAAWVQSWFDRRNAFHSEVQTADLVLHPQVTTVDAGAGIDSGLELAADATGAQELTWALCTTGTRCSVQVAGRGAGATAGFGTPRSLGSIDPAQSPAMAVGARSRVVVGWIAGGHPMAAVAAGPGTPFGSPSTLSPTTYALNLTLAYGPARQALAAWTQGTLNPSVVGAAYAGR